MSTSTIVFLIRHGHTSAVGTRLVSRTSGVSLTPEGRRQAALTRDRLAAAQLGAVYSSPLERTMETARTIAEPHRLDVRVDEGLIEIDFGDWTGLTFDELSRRQDWQAYNRHRGSAPVPNGEPAVAVQRRVVDTLDRLRERHRGGMIAAVSHGDVIRNAVLHVTGVPIDGWHRFEISPASISALVYDSHGARLLFVNEIPGRLPRG